MATHLTWHNRFIQQELRINSNRARLVEAYLRLEYGCLDKLSGRDIKKAYDGPDGISVVIDNNLTAAVALARTYGL